MICRIWHGCTTNENAPRYEEIVRGEVIPAIEARRIPGFLSIDLIRRPVPEGVEFATIMWFADLKSVKAFVGEDYKPPTYRVARGKCSHGSTRGQRTSRS